jgi:selenide,water dikinase
MQAEWPLVSDLVLVGGGHAHALVLRMWAMDPVPGVRLTLVNPGPAAPYTGMLPGLIAGHYRRDEIMIDLVRLARRAGARLILDRATGLDPAAREVILAARGRLRYDVASIDTGIGSDLPEVPGFAAHAVAAKPLGQYAEAWEGFVARRLPRPRVVVLGAGVGGVELALASAHRLRAGGAEPEVTLVQRGGAILPHVGARARATLARHLAAAGVQVVTGAEAVEITATEVVLSTGARVGADFTLSVAGSRPQPWLGQTGLALHEGFLAVGPTLQTSDPAVFAAGDCAHLTHAPRPKAGVYAVRAAPVLRDNLAAALTGGRMRPFHPQADYLKLVSTGGRGAVADKFGLRAGGGWLWRLKDRIDRRFMDRFADYPAMPAPPVPRAAPPGLAAAVGEKPQCGGCGAKVGADALRAAIARLPAPARADVVAGPGDDAAVLAGPFGRQVITTDHLRSFTCDPALMARLAAVHALGDIRAMGAAPQAALAQIVLPRLGPALQGAMLAEVMEAAARVFAAAGADVVGGHSSVGAELTIGFTVTGIAGPRTLTKGGARPGDVLVLTKPLGTGVVLAAEMAMARLPGLILGEAVAATFAVMAEEGGAAAAVLAPVARAMTDVTGFGLAGHLLEICEASGVAAEIDLAVLPLLPGAERLAAAGQASTLAPENRAAAGWRVEGPAGPRFELLFDPQTCGGLLAAVPEAAAAGVMAALPAGAAVIGRVVEGAPGIVAR